MRAVAEGLLWLIRILLGAGLFSFMNVVAQRLACGKKPPAGRSFGGQRGAKISVRSLAVALLGGGLALGCTWHCGAAFALPGGLFGMSWAALTALVFCGILLSIALIDAETQMIPNRLNLAVAGVAVIFTALAALAEPARAGAVLAEHALGAVCVSVPMLLLCLAIPGAFGGGDIKLMAAAGLFLGWRPTLAAALLAILGGGSWGILLLATKKAGGKDHFAFGPFLCAGLVLALFFGEALLGRYLRFFL